MRSNFRVCVAVLSGLVLAGLAERGRANETAAGLVPVKMALESMNATDRAKLWERLDEYAQADSLLEFCGKPINAYNRTWNAVSPCVETSSLKKVGGTFRAKKKKYLDILGGNYPDDEKKKAFCSGLEPKLKDYARIIDAHIAEARTMCDTCLWC